ncbi:hypothetical protein KY495_13645 [Massilia sp. PAMC28688]|uniref:hypothetical protein n=1 Tax=Massilia sp. PAMC28688 TaxID=2861283 RepID=UPI001C639A95|nr:hypothetical protein [Massilia sp. PAMC28688]QYF91832.1 hypothetical protein KY495_13645 [Massilia sp. PAMC28688]
MFSDGGVSVLNRWHYENCINFKSPLTALSTVLAFNKTFHTAPVLMRYWLNVYRGKSVYMGSRFYTAWGDSSRTAGSHLQSSSIGSSRPAAEHRKYYQRIIENDELFSRSKALRSAQKGCVSYALLKDAAMHSARTASDLLDELSYVVASRYFANEIEFEEADAVINALWTVCVSKEFWAEYDRTIPPVTNAVYLAFDAGEYHRESDPPGTDPEVKYTRPMIDAFLAEHVPTRSRL